jgi:stearoyl-CoA desaturase (delta-9 desaturase)
MQSGPLTWVTTHRVHHAFTETDKDPHSPRNGTYWAHMGWIMRGKAQNQSQADMQRYCPDFANDRVHQWINNYYYIPVIALALLLLAIGGWQMVLWGIFLRSVIGWHFHVACEFRNASVGNSPLRNARRFAKQWFDRRRYLW